MRTSQFPPKGDYSSCPHCSVELIYTHPMWQDSTKDYTGPEVEYSRKVLVGIQGMYDGGLFYMCPDCRRTWHRFDPGVLDGYYFRLWEKAEEVMRTWADKRLQRELEGDGQGD